jgi:hypothetical protein
VQANPRVFATLDLGAATTAAALIGRVDRRWRLLGAQSAPSSAPWDRVLELLARRIAAADRDLADAVGLEPATVAELPALVARSSPGAMLAVLTASERALGELAPIVARSGWRWSGLSADRHDARAMTALLLDPSVTTVLVAVGDPPGGDERGSVALLGALAASAAARRPELTVVLAGAVARSRSRFSASRGPGVAAPRVDATWDEAASPAAADAAAADSAAADSAAADAAAADAAPSPAPVDAPSSAQPRDVAATAEPASATNGAPPNEADLPAGASTEVEPLPGQLPARLVIGPTAAPGSPAWAGLTDLLAGLRRDESDARQGIARSVPGLAGALDRRVELIEVGLDGGLRAVATPGTVAGTGSVTSMIAAEAALVPPDLDETRLDQVLGWSTLAFDRHRMRDRLLELRAMPWAGAAGDGGRLRLAAARAAIARLFELTPDLDAGQPPDLVVLSGGAFATVPGPAALLAVADVVRRPSAYQVTLDHARLLGPLGTIEDPAERDRLLADLAGDLLVPLGAVVMPAGIRAGRRPGKVIVTASTGRRELPLAPGGLTRMDLPPGERASIVVEGAEPIRLGRAGRRIALDVAGGIGGVLVDLRDVPLRLPERRESRRDLLVRWQELAWSGSGA